MAQLSNTNQSQPSQTTSDTSTPPLLSNPPSITYDEVDEKFASSNGTFTAKIVNICDNPIMNGLEIVRKRCRITLLQFVKTQEHTHTKRMQAYLCDEWRDIMHYIWNTEKVKNRDNAQISITFYKIKVESIPLCDIDPVMEKQIAFVVDKDVSDDAWIEFKTCVNRICGRNGIRLTKLDITNHLNETVPLNIKNNANPNFIFPPYPYMPISELLQQTKGYLYGYVSFTAEPKPCSGAYAKHNWSKQIRIRDCTLSWDSDDLQVMVFGNDFNNFPIVKDGDLIRLHRIELIYRQQFNQFQCRLKLDSKICPSFIVIDGNLTLANNKESVKQTSSNNYSFDNLVDGYFVKYLKIAVRLRQENMNPDIMNAINTQGDDMPNIVPNALSVNKIPFKLLNEINQNDIDNRISLMVMITGRIDIDNDNNNNDVDNTDEEDTLEFYWVIWDGTQCNNSNINNNKTLFKIYETRLENINDENKWEIEPIYKDAKIIGTMVKLLVASDYETDIMCYNDIRVGSWVEFTNILVDSEKSELIYDKHSKLSTNVHVNNDLRIKMRLDMVYHNIYVKTNVVTMISNVHPHHQYQSYSNIKSVLSIKNVNCKYKIRGKCVQYYPKNIQLFAKHKINNKNVLQFVLCIKDASGSVIKVIFDGKEAQRFFGVDEVVDLRDINNKEQLEEIGHCMTIVMNEKSRMDLCIRSYKVKDKYLIAYKAFDTVLIK